MKYDIEGRIQELLNMTFEGQKTLMPDLQEWQFQRVTESELADLQKMQDNQQFEESV